MLRAKGGDASESRTVAGSALRLYAQIKTAIADRNETAVLEELERNERRALEAFESAAAREQSGEWHDAVSKKFENHVHMVALFTVWYNFVKQHKSLKGLTPAMAAGVTEKLWSMADIVALIDAAAPKPGSRGPYKKKIQTETLPKSRSGFPNRPFRLSLVPILGVIGGMPTIEAQNWGWQLALARSIKVLQWFSVPLESLANWRQSLWLWHPTEAG